jgi:general nucleoside transport system ATP-binding protein
MGIAVLLVSSELDEVFELSDRIAVMYRGKIMDIRENKPDHERGCRSADGRH